MEIPKRIIEKYKSATRNDFIFPVPTNKVCNSYIDKLIQELGIVTEQKVTFHTASHTSGLYFKQKTVKRIHLNIGQ